MATAETVCGRQTHNGTETEWLSFRINQIKLYYYNLRKYATITIIIKPPVSGTAETLSHQNQVQECQNHKHLNPFQPCIPQLN